MQNVVKKARDLSIPLLSGVVAALVWANLDPHSYEWLVHASPFGEHGPLSLHFIVNDLFMVLFFGIATSEIVEAVLPGGSLNPPRKAVNPLLGTIGGVAGPVLAFLAYLHFIGRMDLAGGWGIPTATDIALAWLVARLAFGPQHPAVSFLLLLAVADDAIGLVIIGVFYPDPHHPVEPAFLGLVVAGLAAAWGMRKAGVKSFWAYLAVPGLLSWAGLFLAHVHPALALVPVVPFMPNAGHDDGMFEVGEDHASDTLNRFQHFFHAPVDFGLFAFGLANAGVVFDVVGDASWAVLVALMVGKTIGIYVCSMGAHFAGFPLPEGMDGRSLFVAGLTAAIGLTVALFVAGVAYADVSTAGAAKMGALLSAGAAPLVLFAARVLRVRGAAPSRVRAEVEPAPVPVVATYSTMPPPAE